LIDIDSATDIKRLSNNIKTLVDAWLVLFSKLLRQTIRFQEIGLIVIRNIFLHIPFNKGSPVSFA